MKKYPYTKMHRLEDVLALIQVLALDRAAHRAEGTVGESGIVNELQGPPRSAETWYSLAGEHPEFFRVNPKSGHGLSLAARHVLSEPHGETTPRLSSEFTLTLLQTAITLHDRQVSKVEFLKPLLPSIVAGTLGIISGVCVALFTAYINNPVPVNRFVSADRIAIGVLLDTKTGQYCVATHAEKNTSTVALRDCNTLR